VSVPYLVSELGVFLTSETSDHAEMTDTREAPEASEQEDVPAPAYYGMPIPQLRFEDEG